jgi:hypothetical protein
MYMCQHVFRLKVRACSTCARGEFEQEGLMVMYPKTVAAVFAHLPHRAALPAIPQPRSCYTLWAAAHITKLRQCRAHSLLARSN